MINVFISRFKTKTKITMYMCENCGYQSGLTVKDIDDKIHEKIITEYKL